MKKRLLSLSVLSMGCLPYASVADELISQGNYSEVLMASSIIVTATRTAQSAEETLAPVTVISRQEIEQSRATTVMELLQSRSVGVDVTRNGGPGTSTSIFLRGTASDHVLVLIDGVKASSATSGTFNWNSLPPDQIERIEIVRGPNSTLYGSAAIGGIIQIFTRKSDVPYAQIGGGSYNTRKLSAGAGGELGQGSYHINLNTQASDGFSATNEKHSKYDPDDDGYDNSSITAGFSLPLTENSELALDLAHSQGTTEYDDPPVEDAKSDSANSNANLRLGMATTDSWYQKFSIGYSMDDLETKDNYPATITTRRSTFNWQNDIDISSSGLLTLGAEYEDEDAENTGSFDQRIDNRALYGQYQWENPRVSWKLGLRSDDHSEYGQHNTGSLSVGVPVASGRLIASYGTAFKAPSFNELYYPFYGNPDLKPESSSTMELGYRWGDFSASLFQTRIDDLIAYDNTIFLANNIDEATITGLELEYSHSWKDWGLRTGLTLQDPKDEEDDEQLIRRAREKLFINATHRFSKRADLNLEVSYTGKREDKYGFPSSRVDLDAFTLVNLSGGYKLSSRWSLNGRIENLLDEDYELVYGYNTPGLSAYLNLRYQ